MEGKDFYRFAGYMLVLVSSCLLMLAIPFQWDSHLPLTATSVLSLKRAWELGDRE